MEGNVQISGGTTVGECRENMASRFAASLIVNSASLGYSRWLVSPDARAYNIWDQVTSSADDCMQAMWDGFHHRQGDVNASSLRRYTAGPGRAVIMCKGEDFTWLSPVNQSAGSTVYSPPTGGDLAARTIRSLGSLAETEIGVCFREVARLNTRRRLVATFFDRGPGRPLGFTHTAWRMTASVADEAPLLAFLGVLSSLSTAYLLNLFSTNNHVLLGELAAIPIPNIETCPVDEIAERTRMALDLRSQIEEQFVRRLGCVMPDRGGDGLPVERRVLDISGLPTITINDALLRGAAVFVPRRGTASGRICSPQTEFERVLRLLLPPNEALTQDDLHIHRVPDPANATDYARLYEELAAEARNQWQLFQDALASLDEQVFDWYDYSIDNRRARREGLPWVQTARSA